MSVVALVGNPRAGSRTLAVAVEAAAAVGRHTRRGGPHEVVELSALAPRLFAHDAAVEAALDLVAGAEVLVVASPTYKGTYTGLLKAFLDRLPPGALAGRVALPLLVMGNPGHATAVEAYLRPLLVELGATVPAPGLAVLESELPRLTGIVEEWAARVGPAVKEGATT